MNFLPVNQPNDPPYPISPPAEHAGQTSDFVSGPYHPGRLGRALEWISARLNFYRIHLLHFTLTPLISAAIFYASNGQNQHSYVDSLYMVVSALTCNGCTVVLMASLTLWQQMILYIMMHVGSTFSIAVVTIVIRRRFFRHKFEYLVETNAAVRDRVNEIGAQEARLKGETFRPLTPRHSRYAPGPPLHPHGQPGPPAPTPALAAKTGKPHKGSPAKLRPDMITRVDVPVRVNAMSVDGRLSDGDRHSERTVEEEADEVASITEGKQGESVDEAEQEAIRAQIAELSRRLHTSEAASSLRRRRMSAPTSLHDRTAALSTLLGERSSARELRPPAARLPRATTIEFRDDLDHRQDLRLRHNRTIAPAEADGPLRRGSISSIRTAQRTFTRTSSINAVRPDPTLHTGFGGFPNPLTAVVDLARNHLPALNDTIERHTTIPRTQTFASDHSVLVLADNKRKVVPYTSFDFVVGRNSRFHGLTTAQQEELGGVEFRALTVLLRVTLGYYFLSQLIAVLTIAPWLTYSSTWRPILDGASVNPTWFTFFQVWSAFSNNGMSLVDESMVPFQKAYWLIIALALLVMGGNTLVPVFLRAIIWTLSRLVPSKSRTRETLQFLLDHPRRCFIYLFPSHYTWYLLFVCAVLIAIDWVSFLVLDIGNPQIAAIPTGTRVIDGLFQAIVVRTAGFAIVSFSDVAPALQLLVVVVMYIAVYPIAIGVRSTNVYEEQSIGLFEEDLTDEEAERKAVEGSAGSFIAFHARKQLAFDMWWLVLALWLLCIIEREHLVSEDAPWVTIFSLMFEVSSCYGAVGLSLGAPSGTSLSGGLRTLSKLVLCVVMIRGRHRGLPLAIDRAVMLPDLNIDDDVLSLGRPTTLGANRRVAAVRANSSPAPKQAAVVESSEDELKQAECGSSEGGESGVGRGWATRGQEKNEA